MNLCPMQPPSLLEFTHFLTSTDQTLAKAAEFNSDQHGSRYRSAECRLLRASHSRLAEQRMSSLIWRKHPPDLLTAATEWLLYLQNLPKAAPKDNSTHWIAVEEREAAER